MICFSVFIAVVRAFTAVSRVILSWRIISTTPSAVLGMAVDCPASTDRAATSASMVSDLPGGAARAPFAAIHFHHPMPRAAHRTCQAGAIAAGAFDAERVNPPVGLGPRDQRLVAARIELIEAVNDDIASVTADAAYDTVGCYDAAGARGATVVVPPTKTARVSRRRPRSSARDHTLTTVKSIGPADTGAGSIPARAGETGRH